MLAQGKAVQAQVGHTLLHARQQAKQQVQKRARSTTSTGDSPPHTKQAVSTSPTTTLRKGETMDSEGYITPRKTTKKGHTVTFVTPSPELGTPSQGEK